MSVVQRMPDELEGAERLLGGWRLVTSAWLVAIMLIVLFATVEALASRGKSLPPDTSLAGAVIPRHDPSFPGPDEVKSSDWLERAKAEAYSAW
jgi:hypothetical protein